MNLAMCGVIAIVGSVVVPAASSAQFRASPQPSLLAPPMDRTAYTGRIYAPHRAGFAGTPEMQRQRLAIMAALHDEMVQLRDADGGALSDDSRAYLTRKANRLLAR